MRHAIRTTIPCGTRAPVSLLDLFWDLGASDYALEILAHRDLLLDDPGGLPALMQELPALVAEAGSYRALVDEILEAIREFDLQHRAAGDRRALPGLAAPPIKALPAAAETTPTQTTATARDWEAWRTGGATGGLAGGQVTDLDQVLDAGVGSLLTGLFEGNVGQEFRRWTAQREAKKIRNELDRALEALWSVYASHVATDARTMQWLHDSARRWDAERNRIDALRGAAPYANRSWAPCADALLEAASELAVQMAHAARANVADTLARIDALAAQGDRAMAGYLVYVNRYALFVGRMELGDTQIRAVESASDRLRIKLSQLDRQGLA